MTSNKRFIALALTLALGIAIPLLAWRGGESATATTGGIITMYARDAFSSTLCFADGRYGTTAQDGVVKNRCSDLSFGTFYPNSFSAGIEGGRVAAIVDLGTEDDLRATYKFEETVGGGIGFASIQLKQQKLYISKNRKEKTLQEMSGTDALFGKLRGLASAPILAGHIYVLHRGD